MELCTSHILLAELARILQRTKFIKAISATGSSVDALIMGYVELATLVTPLPIPPLLFSATLTTIMCWPARSRQARI